MCTSSRTLRFVLALGAIAFLSTTGSTDLLQAQAQPAATGDVKVLPVRGNIYMLVGAGGNIAVSVGRDGILMVDSGTAQMSDRVLATVQELARLVVASPTTAKACTGPSCFGVSSPTFQAITGAPQPPKPIRYIINTHLHPDHTGGNEKLAVAGRTFSGGNVTGDLPSVVEDAAVIAHENVLLKMSAKSGNRGTVLTKGLPTETYYGKQMKLSHFMNGEGVLIMHQPRAHTDGDSMVYFRGSDVIVAGDIFSTTSYPVIDLEIGGNVQGVLDGLNKILDLSIAEFRTEGGTMVIPGHGRLGDSADVAYYRDMVTIVRDRIQNMVKKGMTLEQVRAARPTKDYDPRYGTNKNWTTDMFIDAVYRSLTQKK